MIRTSRDAPDVLRDRANLTTLRRSMISGKDTYLKVVRALERKYGAHLFYAQGNDNKKGGNN